MANCEFCGKEANHPDEHCNRCEHDPVCFGCLRDGICPPCIERSRIPTGDCGELP